MNRAEATEILATSTHITGRLAEIMVTDWERAGWRTRKGQPVTARYVTRQARTTRMGLKASRNAARDCRMPLLIELAKRSLNLN